LVKALPAGDHVRVILDNSRSMLKNDIPRLATLSTVLLYDLANPNISMGDSFEVITFDTSWPLGKWKSGPPPAHTGSSVRVKHLGRAAFVDEITKIPYTAANTYYYPVLKLAVEDLKSTPGGAADRRVIVLVTDGLPEDPDLELIKKDLVSQLGAAGIRLYILALGPEAASKSAILHEILGGPNVGDLFVDSTGRDLLRTMIQIFSRSFGYSSDAAVTISGPVSLNLEGGQRPSRTAVVSYWTNAMVPQLRLQPPPGGSVNSPDGVRSAQEKGASFSVIWTLGPSPGLYTLPPVAPGAAVAVLRPAALLLDVQPQKAGDQTHSTMASVQFPLRVMVRPHGGMKGDPGPVDFSYQAHGPRHGAQYDWDDRPEASPSAGVANAEGRYFDILPSFTPDRGGPREFYEGWLTVDLRRHESVIGTLTHRVLVYPYVQLLATPPAVIATVHGQARAIQPHETGCAIFEFRVNGVLPHADRPVYPLRADIDPALKPDVRFSGARYTLDGSPLDYDETADTQSDWYVGKSLSRETLVGKHEACVQIGRPKNADPSRPADIPLRFTLLETPYSSSPTVEPVTLRVFLAMPGYLERYAAFLALGLTLLILAILAWYTRFRPQLPPALLLASARSDAPEPLPASRLPNGSPVMRLLGLTPERFLFAENGALLLGRVKPVNGQVYRFRPASGVNVAGPKPTTASAMTEALAVGRTYTAHVGGAAYDFRLEYR